MVTVDNIMNNLKTDVASLITNAQTALNTLFSSQIPVPPEPTPSPPVTNVLFEDDFATDFEFTADNQVSSNGKWKIKYRSGGRTYMKNGVLTSYPQSATVSTQTFSTLIMSTKTFQDFQLDLDMKTVKQTRINSPPKDWETGDWVFWSYADEREGPLGRSNHHYYFLLKTNGFEWGKKDNAPGDVTNEKQIFIKTGPTPKCVIGQKQHVTIIKKGFHHTIKVDGITVLDMDDPQVNDPVKMAAGPIGLYEEDAQGEYDNVKVIAVT